MASAALLCAPVIALTAWANLSAYGDGWSWVLLPVGAVYGTAITLAGLRAAAPRTARQLPGILMAAGRS